jgi:mannose-6-phosphate isomerase-like protein (cupin superfamily)
MSDAYEVAHIDELDAFPVDDEGLTWRPIRRRFDIRSFGTNAYTADRAGQRVVEEHAEADNHEELYVVIAGRATFTLDGDEVDAPAGTLVFCRPGARRGAVAQEPGTTVLAIGAKAGVVFEPSLWEETFAGVGYARLGDLERSRATFRTLTEGHPDAWQGWFNWACIEATKGDREQALDLLERAAEQDADEVRRWAPEDRDLDSIRDEPRYRQLVGPAD